VFILCLIDGAFSKKEEQKTDCSALKYLFLRIGVCIANARRTGSLRQELYSLVKGNVSWDTLFIPLKINMFSLS